MFSASTTYEKQLRIEKTRLSHQVWSHGGSSYKKRTLNGHFFRPAETDSYVYCVQNQIFSGVLGKTLQRSEMTLTPSIGTTSTILRRCKILLTSMWTNIRPTMVLGQVSMRMRRNQLQNIWAEWSTWSRKFKSLGFKTFSGKKKHKLRDLIESNVRFPFHPIPPNFDIV